jgi:cytoskeletal protein RodZ
LQPKYLSIDGRIKETSLPRFKKRKEKKRKEKKRKEKKRKEKKRKEKKRKEKQVHAYIRTRLNTY